MELSGLDLPDVTVGPAASTAKGLSRKRPRRSFNTTAFEKRLKDGDGKIETSIEEVHRLKMRLWGLFFFLCFCSNVNTYCVCWMFVLPEAEEETELSIDDNSSLSVLR